MKLPYNDIQAAIFAKITAANICPIHDALPEIVTYPYIAFDGFAGAEDADFDDDDIDTICYLQIYSDSDGFLDLNDVTERVIEELHDKELPDIGTMSCKPPKTARFEEGRFAQLQVTVLT